MPVDWSDDLLLAAPLAKLMASACEVRDARFGRRVTYSPKVFIPLTQLCRDTCDYCTFAQPPARVAAPYLSLDEVVGIARAGARAGCHEALFTFGERPELRYQQAQTWLADHGYATTIDYLAAAAKHVLDETGLLPHANARSHHEHEERHDGNRPSIRRRRRHRGLRCSQGSSKNSAQSNRSTTDVCESAPRPFSKTSG